MADLIESILKVPIMNITQGLFRELGGEEEPINNLISGPPIAQSGFTNQSGNAKEWTASIQASYPFVTWSFPVVAGKTYQFSGTLDTTDNGFAVLVISLTAQPGSHPDNRVAKSSRGEYQVPGERYLITPTYTSLTNGVLYACLWTALSYGSPPLTLKDLTVVEV